MLEDVTFSEALGRWYLSCMGSSNVVVGNAETDEPLRTIALPEPYPHGITVNDTIDRILLTSTSNPVDFSDAGETITVLRASTEEVLSTHKVSNQPSPSRAEPVEIFFVPGAEPPLAYITNATEGTLWMAEWQPEAEAFGFGQVFDFATLEQGVALEVYFKPEGDRAYVTMASPGHLNAFDISKPRQPRHLWADEAGPGAHQLVFSPDGSRAYVQNGLSNIEGINDGSISIIDLGTGTKTGGIDTFKDAGFTMNMIALPPAILDIAQPFGCRRRGVETKIVAGGQVQAPDVSLIRTLRNADDWAGKLRAGTSLTTLARRGGVSELYMSRIIHLVGLSPPLQDAIVAGRHLADLTLKALLRTPLPIDRDSQERLLTFPG